MSSVSRLLLVVAALAASAHAMAQNNDPRRRVRSDEAADTVRRVEIETGGDVLRAERMQRGGREVYRLKVLTPEGRVRVMQDDPRSRRERRQADRDPRRDDHQESERRDSDEHQPN